MVAMVDRRGNSEPHPSLDELIEDHRELLSGFLARHGAGVLRFDALDDLVQGTILHVLEARADFHWQGPEAFRAWLFTLARSYIARRHRHWRALKRDAGRVVRFSLTGSATSVGLEPWISQTGPLTFSVRKESLRLAVKALSVLTERDRDLVMGEAQGENLADQAARMGLSYEAAQRARLRAIERFKTAYEVLGDQRSPSG